MSCGRDELDQALMFTRGHNDAWEQKAIALPCSCLSCPTNVKYKEGHRAGTTARYYYNQGYQAGKDSMS